MRIGFIGAGHIAVALGEGWMRDELEHRPSITYFDVRSEAVAHAAAVTGARRASTLGEVVEGAEVVVVAVRPQHAAAVLAEAAPLLGGRALISVAAGVTLAELRAALPADARVARVMPNVAARLGHGVFLFVPGTLGDRRASVERLFALAGEVVVLDEEYFDSATAVAGCMPGMLAMLVRDFAHAGEKRGLESDVARRLAVAGVYGAAAVIAADGDPEAVITATATPGGMTAAALTALEAHDIAEAVRIAVHEAAERAKELA